MGLDMYVYSQEKVEPVEIATFRKVNWLHGWMEEEWSGRGNRGDFNCEKLFLDEDLLSKLERDIRDRKIKPTEGFFFGVQEIFDEDIEDALKMIKDAREELEDGREVYYYSWW